MLTGCWPVTAFKGPNRRAVRAFLLARDEGSLAIRRQRGIGPGRTGGGPPVRGAQAERKRGRGWAAAAGEAARKAVELARAGRGSVVSMAWALTPQRCT